MKKEKRSAVFCVLLAGILWGSMGLFVRRLNEAGLFALEVVQIRVTLAFLFVGVYLAAGHREKLKIRLRDSWCFFGTGVLSLLFFTWCYFTGMTVAGLGVMGVLLYTAPAFVMLLSVLLFGEKLTGGNLLALAMTFAGCCLVSGLGTGMRISGKGLLLGLGAGFGYALYSIFGRYAIRRGYDSWTITFYTFAFCAAGCAFLSDWALIFRVIRTEPTLLFRMVLMGLLTGFLAYVLYTKGLEGMESSRASILASVEPVVAAIVGAVFFSETITLHCALGIALVLGGIAVLSLRKKE